MAALVYTSWPDARSAQDAARILVDERLAACVNIVPDVCSVYRWEGTVQEENEVLMFVKTAQAQLAALREKLLALHPYDLPAFSVLQIDEAASHGPYLDWLRQESQP